MRKIEELTKDIRNEFAENEKLNELITVLNEFVESFGKAANTIAKSGALSKGLGNGNFVENIPEMLSGFSPFIQQKENVKYIGWQANGMNYLDIADACPFCSQHLDSEGKISKATVRKVAETYNSNNIKHLNTVLDIFEKLADYFSDSTKLAIDSFCKSSDKVDTQNTQYLLAVKQEAKNFLDSLNRIKNLGFNQLKDVENIVATLSALPIKIELLTHFRGSSLSSGIVKEINQKLSSLLQHANQLNGVINSQKAKISETIKMHEEEINGFLSNAGFRYLVKIEGKDEEKIILYPVECTGKVENVSEHLSYGERNSLALVLFTFQAEHDKADLIILDDPISSFDGNKKFAIIHLLFMKGESRTCKFSNKTVLLLTHDFGSVIDLEYTIKRKLSCSVRSTYLRCNEEGILSEKLIQRNNIISCIEAARKIYTSTDYHIASRLSALRRYTEVIEGKNDRWNYISSVLHCEEPARILEDYSRQPFSKEEILQITYEINNFIADFSHDGIVALFNDRSSLIESYKNSINPYEKLQIFRVMQGNSGTANDIVNKFVNETFHVENDYLFQLDPFEFEQVPDYIIKECDVSLLGA